MIEYSVTLPQLFNYFMIIIIAVFLILVYTRYLDHPSGKHHLHSESMNTVHPKTHAYFCLSKGCSEDQLPQ